MTLKLDLGCGRHKREGFLGVDSSPDCGADVVHDLNVIPWPFEDASVDEVNCSHFLEHLDGAERIVFMNELYRVMKPGGLLSIQMGYGEGYGKAGYYENHYDVESTSSFHDTLVTSPDQIRGDLERIGFVDFGYAIRPAFDDGHPHWIFAKAHKPSLAAVQSELRKAA